MGRAHPRPIFLKRRIYYHLSIIMEDMNYGFYSC